MQKCLMPSTTQPSGWRRTVVSIRNVRERLTAGSLPQLPKSVPLSTTAAKYFRFCASVPSAAMKRMTVECMCTVIAVLAHPPASFRTTAT